MTDETLFHLALEQPADERAAFLDRACADDPELRRRVEALLQAHEAPGSFLREPPPGVTATTLAPPARTDPEAPGRRIWPYKLLQEIGEGGMGVVFLAEQLEPV